MILGLPIYLKKGGDGHGHGHDFLCCDIGNLGC